MGAGSKAPRKGSKPGESFDAIFPGTNYLLDFTATSAQIGTLGSASILRLFSTQDCFVKFGSNPTAATTTSMFLPSGIVEYVGVTPNQKMAVLQNSAAGRIYVTEGEVA